MTTPIPEEPEGGISDKWLIDLKESIISELLDVLDPHAKIGNRKKLLLDFVNREKKASTGVGKGFAIPHIRSMQAKEFMIGFGRYAEGYPYDAIDGEPVRFFFVMAAPPYEDALYLKVFKALSELFVFDTFAEDLLKAQEPFDVIKAIKDYE